MLKTLKTAIIAAALFFPAAADCPAQGPPEEDMGVREYDELVLKASSKTVHQGFFRRNPDGTLSRNSTKKIIFRIEVGKTKGISMFVGDDDVLEMRFVQTEEQVFRKRLRKELKPSRIQIPAYERKAAEAESKGFAEIAEELYREVVKLDPTYLKGYMSLGKYLRKRFKFDDEMRLYEDGLKSQVIGKESLHTGLGSLLVRIGLPEAAEARFQKAMDENPKYVPALLEYGRLLLSFRSYQKAAEMLKAAVAQAYSKDEKGACQLALGEALLKLGDSDGAKKQFEDAAFNIPESQDAKVSLGSVLYMKGETARAKDIFMSVLGISVIGGGTPPGGEPPPGGAPPPGGTDGKAPAKPGSGGGAGASPPAGGAGAQGGQAEKPPAGGGKAAEGEEEGGEEEEGEEEAGGEVFTEFSPFKSSVYVNLALCLIRDQDFENALKYLDQAQGLDPTSAKPHAVRGYLKEKEGDFEAAAHCYAAGIETDPSDAFSHYSAGVLHMRSGDLAAAQESFTKAIERNHVFSDAYYNLGVVSINRLQPAEAVRYVEHALALSPLRTDWKTALGAAYIMAGRQKDAEACFKDVLDRDAANLLAKIGEIYLLYYKPKWEAEARERLKMLLEDRENIPAAVSAYVKDIIGLIEENMGKAQWQDGFERQDSFTVGGKWEEKKRFGVSIRIAGNRVVFSGEQKNPGETVMETPRTSSEFVKFEIDLKVSSFEAFTSGIRVVHRMSGRGQKDDVRAGVFFGRNEKNRLVYGIWDAQFKRWKDVKDVCEWPLDEAGAVRFNRLGIEIARDRDDKSESYVVKFLLNGKPVDEGFDYDKFKKKVAAGDFWSGVYAWTAIGQKVDFLADNATIVEWKKE